MTPPCAASVRLRLPGLPYALVALGACGGDDPVPDDLSEPLVWLLAHVDDPEADVLARVDRLAAYAEGFDEAAPADRRFAPGAPTDAHRDALRDDDAVLGDGVLAATAIVATSDEDLDDHQRLQGVLDRPCLEGDFTTWTRAFVDGACLPDDDCDDALTEEAYTTAAGAPGTARARLRALRLDDGRHAVVARTVPTSAGGWLGVDVFVGDVTRTRRVSARWAEGASADWSDDAAAALLAAAARAEAWLDGDAGCAAEAL